MAVTLNFYADAALEQPLASLTCEQDTDNLLPPVTTRIWVGSTAAGRQFQAASDPGVDQLTLSLVDANAGTGQPATAYKLALTEAGLAAAVAGAALDLGTTLLSGAANAVAVWIRGDDQVGVVGNYLDISLKFNTVQESAV